MADADLELHIKEPERCVIVCGTCVFARTEEKEESHDDHVRDCLGFARLSSTVVGDILNDTDWDGFHPMRRGVFTGVSFEHSAQAEVNGTRAVFPSIPGPHAGHRLAHRAYGVRNRARSNAFTGVLSWSTAVAGGKDL